jgi:hypothetical protein
MLSQPSAFRLERINDGQCAISVRFHDGDIQVLFHKVCFGTAAQDCE